MNKKNDWIAINLNSGEDVSLDSLSVYGINPDNTGLQSEDYYKNIKQVRDSFKNADGNFDDKAFHDFYESAKRSYNDYQQSDFTQKIIDEIESSPYDIFSLGSKIMDSSAAIYRSKDPQRTTMGLGNLFEVGSPTFDIREVAQANKARDEQGNVLDWSPNDKGGLFKGLFRPTMVLATWDEDGTHIENGIEVAHRKGDFKVDEYGDPYYEKLGNREIYGKETLHYWDTITRDDSAWNKIDFMDSDGLHKSIGGTVMRTAFSLLPYFTPIGPYLGYVGATIALGQTLPVLSKGLEGILVGSTDNAFGRSMSSLEAVMDRFGHSQSRDTMGKFLSFENIGDIIATSAGQLFQQRMIANIPNLLRKTKNAETALATSKFGRNLALGYMITTSATDAYSTFKEAGATDRMAGIGLLGVTAGLSLLMNNNYFKDFWFTGTFMDEDIAMRDTVKQLVKESTIEPFQQYAAMMPKAMSKYQQKLASTWLYKQIEKNVVNKAKPLFEKLVETRPTIGMIEKAAASEGKNGVKAGMKASLYLNRMLNEGLEETMEEGVTDAMKLVTMGLDALGVQVSKSDQELDFGLTLRDALSRYGAAFLGGAIGGAIFEGFNQFEGGEYDSLLEKSLVERLVWYERNGYGQEVRDRVKRLYKQGKLGNQNLSSKGNRIKSVDEKPMVVYGQGDENDNQNLFTYNVINSYLDRLDVALNDAGLFSDNKIFDEIWKAVREKHQNDDSDPEVQLYHFLEDLDTAKALTITQMGFLDAVKQDADKWSFAILNKMDEIEKAKQKLRIDNHLTDTDSSKEKEVFKNSLYLKTLENELKEMKDSWDKILKGEKNGYYIGYAKIMANPAYSDWYTNPKSIENQQKAFPETDIDNWSKYKYGIKYSSVKEDELKGKIENDWEAFKTLMNSSETKTEDQIALWRTKSRVLYDTHIKFSQKFASDIMKLGTAVKGSSTVDPWVFIQKQIKGFANSIDDLSVKSSFNNFLINVSNLSKETDANKKKELMDKVFNEFLTDAFRFDVSGELRLKFLKQLNTAIESDKIVGLDLSELRQSIIKSFTNPQRKLIESEQFDTVWNSFLGSFRDFENSDKLDEMSNEEFQEVIDSLSDDERKRLETSELDNYIKGVSERDLVTQEIARELEARRPLLSQNDPKTKQEFIRRLNSLLDSMDLNSSEMLNKYNQLIDYILENTKSFGKWDTPFTKKDAEELVHKFIGNDVLETLIEERERELKLSENPIADLLKKFDIFTGGHLFNVIDTITKEEAFERALKDAKEYKITSKTTEEELETALSFLNIITAVINSSLDGINESINLSNSDSLLAVIDPSTSNTIGVLINQIENRINHLLNTSRENKRKTTRAQQDTFLIINRKRVEQLVNIGKIQFGNSPELTIDFKEEWEKENFSLNNVNLTTSKEFDKAFRNFESRIANKLKSIVNGSNDLKSDFIEKIVKSFGNSDNIYLQQTGELTNDEERAVIPAYAMVNYLLTITELDPTKFSSIWKTACLANKELIPLFGQEYLVRENLASFISVKDGKNLFNLFHEYIKEHFPEYKDSEKKVKWTDPNYITNREILDRFSSIDGIGGSGKTTGVDYLTNECAKLYYNGNVSTVAMGGTSQAAEGVHSALKLSLDSTKPMSFDEFMKLICTDDNGKILFDYSSNNYYKKIDNNNSTPSLKKTPDNSVSDGKTGTLASINVDKLESLFTTKDGLRIIYLDEVGLLNVPQLLLLNELGKKYNFFISASGDSLQNKAKIKRADNGQENDSGIEDLIYHRTPPLTISMRAENNGVYKNTEILKNLLYNTRNSVFSKDLSSPESEFNKTIKQELNKIKTGSEPIKLIFSEDTLAGHQLIKSGDVKGIVEKALSIISELKASDPDKKHQIAIVTDSDSKRNQYQSMFGDKIGTDIILIDPKGVQGKEYDFVIIDKEFNLERPYSTIQDFYTMLTRARRGAAIVDDKSVMKDLGFDSVPDNTASEPVSGATAEEKTKLFEEYVNWRMGLMEDIPEYKPSTPPPSISIPKPSVKPTGATKPEMEPKEVTEVIVAGIDKEEFNPSDKSKDELVQHYIEKLSKEGDSYHKKSLELRNNALNSKTSSHPAIDSDILIEELKNFDDSKFEDFPLSIAKQSEDPSRDIESHRIVIATIARAILNNAKAEDRKQYIQDASSYLNKHLRRVLGGDSEIVTSLQTSFDNGGFFFYDKGYFYYTFESRGTQYAIPIAKYDGASKGIKDETLFKNLTFNIAAGSIPITTNGEIMTPARDVISEIDGVICDDTDEHNVSVNVGTITTTLREELDKKWKEAKGSTLEDTIRNAIRFLFGIRGKSFIALNAGSKTFQSGSKFFNPILENDNYLSGVNQEYGNDITENALLALQQITSIKEWYEVIEILKELVRAKTEQNSDKIQPNTLTAFFNEDGDNIISKFNQVSENNEAISERYRTLGEYRILNSSAIDKLTNAIFRYLSLNPKVKWRNRFHQGFVKWLRRTKVSNDGKDVHKRGFSIRFKTINDQGDTITHDLTVVPKIGEIKSDKSPEVIGYNVLYSNTKHAGAKSIYESSSKEDTPWSLFGNTDFDFDAGIVNVFDKVKDNSEVSWIKDTFNSKESIQNAIKNSTLTIFPVDLMFSAQQNGIDVGLPSKIYSAYETDIFSWMTEEENGERKPLSSEQLKDLENFLTNDTIFKHNLYRDIRAEVTDSNKPWSSAKGVNLGNSYVDIIKVFAPVYTLGTEASVQLDSSDYKTLSGKLKDVFNQTNDLNDNKPAIKSNVVNLSWNKKTNQIEFSGSLIVNSIWLEKYCKDWNGKEGNFEISFYDPINNIIVIDKNKYTLTSEGESKLFENIEDLENKVKEHFAFDVKGNKLIGNKIILNDGTIYKNAELVGIENNRYYFRVSNKENKIIVTLEFDTDKNIPNAKSIFDRGLYLGTIDDGYSTDYYLYLNEDSIQFVSDSPDNETAKSVKLSDIRFMDNSVIVGDFEINDSNLIDKLQLMYNDITKPNLKHITAFKLFNSNVWLCTGEHSISASQMKLLSENPDVDNSNVYHIIAYDDNKIGYYTGDDLTTFKWAKIKYFKPDDVTEIGEYSEGEMDMIDPNNVGISYYNFLESVKQNNIDKFSDTSSTTDVFSYPVMKNGAVAYITEKDIIKNGVSVKQTRAIRNYITSNYGNVQDLSIGKDVDKLNLSTINVRFRMNGKPIFLQIKVDPDNKVHLISNDASNDFDRARLEFNNLWYTLSEQFNEAQKRAEGKTLTSEQVSENQALRNQLSNVLTTLNSIKEELAVETREPDDKVLIQLFNQLPDEYKTVVKKFYKEFKKRKKC